MNPIHGKLHWQRGSGGAIHQIEGKIEILSHGALVTVNPAGRFAKPRQVMFFFPHIVQIELDEK